MDEKTLHKVFTFLRMCTSLQGSKIFTILSTLKELHVYLFSRDHSFWPEFLLGVCLE